MVQCGGVGAGGALRRIPLLTVQLNTISPGHSQAVMLLSDHTGPWTNTDSKIVTVTSSILVTIPYKYEGSIKNYMAGIICDVTALNVYYTWC